MPEGDTIMLPAEILPFRRSPSELHPTFSVLKFVFPNVVFSKKYAQPLLVIDIYPYC
jgi:hypothetical protein